MGNGNVHRIKVLLASLVAVIAAMADIYIIVNAPHNYIVLGVISLILLIAVYLVISGMMQLRDWNNLKREEQYNNLMTSQKACYLQVRRSFRETGGKINELDKKIAPLATAGEVNHQKISGLLDVLMQDQKKVAKLTVSRSKENANAIMNSNDKVIEEMFKIQEVMNGIMEQVGDKKEDNQSEEFAKVEERQQELLSKMQQLEDSLKSQMGTITDKIQEIPELEKEFISEMKLEMSEPEPVLEKVEPELPEPELVLEEVEPEMSEPEPVLEEMEPELPEPVLEKVEELEPEPVIEEAKLEEAESEEAESEEPKPVDANKTMSPEDIAALIAGNVENEEIIAQEAVTEELEVKDSVEAEELVETEESVIEEPVVEEPTPIADPNKMMSPEDIAALIAGGVGNEKEVLPETVEEPEIEAAEESPVMPDLSDPNRKMSPEDIAALIANM